MNGRDNKEASTTFNPNWVVGTQVFVGDPADQPEVQLVDSTRKPIDKSKLTNAQIEFKDPQFELKMDFSNIDDPNLFKDVVDTVNVATDEVYNLRLKSISEKGLNDVEKNLLNIKNGYISEIYTARDRGNITEQIQMEAEARMLTAEAELYLASNSEDDTNIEAIYKKLRALAQKMGPNVPHAIQSKLQELESRMASKSKKS